MGEKYLWGEVVGHRYHTVLVQVSKDNVVVEGGKSVCIFEAV